MTTSKTIDNDMHNHINNSKVEHNHTTKHEDHMMTEIPKYIQKIQRPNSRCLNQHTCKHLTRP